MNKMVKAINIKGEKVYVTIPAHAEDAMIELFKTAGVTEIETFESNSMKLEDLPEEIQAKVKNTLKAYDSVNVTFEHNRFESSVGVCIKANYGIDHFVCGRYEAKEVYTEEERRENFKEEFGYYPYWGK